MNLISNLLKDDLDAKLVQQIYTTGCEGKEVVNLPLILKNFDAILIDIRFAPGNSPLKWSKEYLKLLLKNKYLHVPNLGNRSNKEGKIAIQNLALGIKIITELRVNVVFMCACEMYENCHRRKIAEELKEQGIESEEIADWKNIKDVS